MTDIDSPGLVAALRSRVDVEVRFRDSDRALYATDSSNDREVPIGVVVPHDADALEEAVRVCAAFGAPITHRGGGTALAGQATKRTAIIDNSKHCNRFLSIDSGRRLAVVEPGITLDELQKRCRPHGLRFGPDPATHDHKSLGGMIGNNAAGPRSVIAGVTSHNVKSLDILTCDGLRLTVGPTTAEELEQYMAEGGREGAIHAGLKAPRDRYAGGINRVYPKIPRRVSGFNLDALIPDERGMINVATALVGTEGTCVTVLSVTLPSVPGRSGAIRSH